MDHKGNTGDIIFLQVSDKQIAKVTEGHFQYGIELEIEDRTQNFLISKLSSFERSIKNYERVANIARRAGYNQYNKKAFDIYEVDLAIYHLV